jgi:hypothetical protein
MVSSIRLQLLHGVKIFLQKVALIDSHACSLQSFCTCAPNGIPLMLTFSLPVDTLNSVQTLQASPHPHPHTALVLTMNSVITLMTPHNTEGVTASAVAYGVGAGTVVVSFSDHVLLEDAIYACDVISVVAELMGYVLLEDAIYLDRTAAGVDGSRHGIALCQCLPFRGCGVINVVTKFMATRLDYANCLPLRGFDVIGVTECMATRLDYANCLPLRGFDVISVAECMATRLDYANCLPLRGPLPL